ncbi:ABC transporter substrate-binding protein [Lichenibacterium minor]|uniref:ABC transporter substrate-binding protein n=2 Tax=Lichenibacterium minor TaxID=2316528 RepID=A0A4Q2U1I0_9HYPH|nr:ABC transporter substrate-binding protein [Lichenibacterium minor]
MFDKKLKGLAIASALGAVLALGGGGLSVARAQGVLRIGMTASDIPLTTGQSDNGGEGQRFIGFTLYDALIEWDLSHADRPSVLVPGLATSWSVDAADKTKWTFHLREGVKFHDGSAFDASAVVWNLDKLLKTDAPQFDPRQAAQGRSRIPAVASYRAVDPMTLEITTKAPDATLPYQIAWITLSSPANWVAQGKSWDAVAQHPSGTGPWKMEHGFVPRQRAELTPNKNYWDPKRVPHLDEMVLVPLPEPNARVAALRSGEVDWIEAPAPDAVPSLKAAGFSIVTNSYPHNWTWHFSRLPDSPWNDVRVRKAANLAVDRGALKDLLGGLMIPAEGFFPPNSQWFGHPTFKITFDLDAAKALMKQAGYGPDKRIKTKVIISPSGSGQMLPLSMNEFLQQSLAEIGIDVEFEIADWNTVTNLWRAGAKDPGAKGATAINYSYFIQDPFTGFIRHLQCNLTPPAGTNWGYYCDKDMDALFDQVRNTFDQAEQDKVLQKVHEKYVDDALFLMVAHDVNARAIDKKVKNFVQAQNWFQDFSPIVME